MPLYSRKGYRQLWALQKAKQNTHTSIKKIKANVDRASFQKYSVRNVNMYCVLTLGINSKCFILAMLSDTKHSLFLILNSFFDSHRREWKVAVVAAGVTATYFCMALAVFQSVSSQDSFFLFPLPPSVT